MTVRVFSSSTITLDEGTLDTIQNGAWTYAAIFKRSGSTTDGTQFLLSLHSSTGSNQKLAFSYSSSSALQVTLVGTSRTFGASFTIANNVWYCLVITKASGTATPRANLYNYGTSTWVGWTNGTGTLDNNADALVEGYVGNAPGGFPLNGKIACMGLWSSVLSDTNAETLETAAQNWLDLSPTAMWRFNQASTATAVVDDTGNGADQTAISGTSVDTGDDPAFDFDLGGGSEAFGTATGVFGFSAPGAGQKTVHGAATAPFGFAAAAAGARIVYGAATGLFGFAAPAAGEGTAQTVFGAATGEFGFTAPATGSRIVYGAGVAAFGFTATAAAKRTVHGTATGAFGFTATIVVEGDIVFRPDTGIVVRPFTGTVTRP